MGATTGPGEAATGASGGVWLGPSRMCTIAQVWGGALCEWHGGGGGETAKVPRLAY